MADVAMLSRCACVLFFLDEGQAEKAFHCEYLGMRDDHKSDRVSSDRNKLYEWGVLEAVLGTPDRHCGGSGVDRTYRENFKGLGSVCDSDCVMPDDRSIRRTCDQSWNLYAAGK